ncbi:MAG: hypothetical protein M3R15_01580 [Acidobacteriota bacterium]|nr:hypothetical protein [Acidobacteriota bacterium]
MAVKKSTAKRKKKASTNGNRERVGGYAILHNCDKLPQPLDDGWRAGDELDTYPMRRNPKSSPEEEANRLALRKALTLKAFQTAYENHRSSRKTA